MNVKINHDRFHEYRSEYISLPEEYLPLKLLELIEYYLFTAAEDGWSDEEKKNMLAFADGISKIIEDRYRLSLSLTDVYSISG